ncbi:hypothetical protein AC1031_004873 [Aphanomyces cochlioides]|nr:hypothetical protein AC1031_004873 [Aphanomyces cochlioides]
MLQMTNYGSFKLKRGGGRDSQVEDVTLVTIDDVDEENQEEEYDDVDEAYADKTIFELLDSGNASAIKKRLENLSDEELAAVDDNGFSILECVVKTKKVKYVKTIVERTKYKVVPNYLGAPLLRAVELNDSFEVVDYLIKTFGASLDFQYSGDEGTILQTAARNVHQDILKLLLASGADVNIVNENGETPLMSAIQAENIQNVEALIQGGANIHHQSHEGKTVLHFATSENVEILDLLFRAGADIDVKDNDGNYVLQVADNEYVKNSLRLERITRALYPAHIMARNGDLKGIQRWLGAMAAKGPGQSQLWHGQHLHDGEETDVQLRLKLVRDVKSSTYKCVGTFADDRGAYYVTGKWNESHLEVKKFYAENESFIEYNGDIDEETAQWKGEFSSGGETPEGEFCFTIPLFECFECHSKVPEENKFCFDCSSVEKSVWSGKTKEDGEWNEIEISLEVREDVAAQVYRLVTPQDNSDISYQVSGCIWKNGRIKVAKHFTTSIELFDGVYDKTTKKWMGELIDSDGATNKFIIHIPMWICSECENDVPVENSKCLECNRDSIYNWKGEICQNVEWQKTGLFVAVVRYAEHGLFRLVGEGTDDVDTFEAFGTFEGNLINLTKVYPQSTVELSGTFDEDTKTWSGAWVDSEGKTDDFRITIPMYACSKCDSLLPVSNELCLDCSVDAPEWNPMNGSLLQAWIGQYRTDGCD